uniref:(northern house mosquito) hypothetical protein n=1 Tax=Culex pipiens TaxID=7175 RepID=A0A8D8BT79_CULPI
MTNQLWWPRQPWTTRTSCSGTPRTTTLLLPPPWTTLHKSRRRNRTSLTRLRPSLRARRTRSPATTSSWTRRPGPFRRRTMRLGRRMRGERAECPVAVGSMGAMGSERRTGSTIRSCRCRHRRRCRREHRLDAVTREIRTRGRIRSTWLFDRRKEWTWDWHRLWRLHRGVRRRRRSTRETRRHVLLIRSKREPMTMRRWQLFRMLLRNCSEPTRKRHRRRHCLTTMCRNRWRTSRASSTLGTCGRCSCGSRTRRRSPVSGSGRRFSCDWCSKETVRCCSCTTPRRTRIRSRSFRCRLATRCRRLERSSTTTLARSSRSSCSTCSTRSDRG